MTMKTTKTNKLTKESLVNQLKEMEGQVKDKSIVDRIAYTLVKYAEKATDVTLSVLKELVNDCEVALATPKPIEALKLKGKTKSKDTAKTEDEDSDNEDESGDEETPTEEKETKQPEKKADPKKTVGNKKSDPKDEKPKETPKEEKKAGFTFPEVIEVEGLGSLAKNQSFKSVADIDAFAEDENNTVVLALRWTQTDLKKFAYDLNGILEKKPKSFPNDMDILLPYFVSREQTFIYAVSHYTETFALFNNDTFERVDGVLYTNGIEFEIYTNIPEPPKTETKKNAKK